MDKLRRQIRELLDSISDERVLKIILELKAARRLAAYLKYDATIKSFIFSNSSTEVIELFQ